MRHINSMKFWINAFIPQVIPGYTIRVPAGPHRGKSMIPGPGAINIRMTVPGVPVSVSDFSSGLEGRSYQDESVDLVHADGIGASDCYLTDQRSFSNYIHAKSRMHSEFRLDFTGSSVRMTEWHNCDWTTECDCEDGSIECYEKGKTNRMKFHMRSRPSSTASSGVVVVEMKCSANNPCSPSSRLFGDIDYEGTITVDVRRRRIDFLGKIDQFPAYEAYATINDGAGVPLFQIDPPRGNTVRNLPGGANRHVRESLQDVAGTGVFSRNLTL